MTWPIGGSGLGLGEVLCTIDLYQASLNHLLFLPRHLVEDIAHLVRPAPLQRDGG